MTVPILFLVTQEDGSVLGLTPASSDAVWAWLHVLRTGRTFSEIPMTPEEAARIEKARYEASRKERKASPLTIVPHGREHLP